MTKDELLSLPPAIAIGLIWDASASLQSKLAGVEKPRGPLSPKYDRRIYRKGGYNYASEMTLESLTYWLGKKREGAASGSEWAPKDAKEASELERWVTWRTWYPNQVWSGTRGDGEMQAKAPSKSPTLHQRDASPVDYIAENPRAAAFAEALRRSPPPPDDEGDANEDYGL